MAGSPSTSLLQTFHPQARSALDFACQQSQRILKKYPGYTPMYTVQGKWNLEGERWTHWCEGFFPGILWLLHQYTADSYWREQAQTLTTKLEPRKLDRNVHDLGFLFGSTYLRWYRQMGDKKAREIVIEAGRTLALRRQRGGYLASFIGPESLFIDIMMNVPIILWAARETGDSKLLEIGLEHCRTTARTIVRPDGSTAHEGIFDLETGKFLRESTHQGLKAESAWSRGQAWALYGFTVVSRLAGPDGPEFLEVARRCADFYLGKTPEGKVPLWDFDVADDGQQPLDSSAAAIAASGLLDLAEEVPGEEDRQSYRRAAVTTLENLCSDDFLAKMDPDWEGIVKHGVYHLHKGLGVDESVAWGEFFFVEALVKSLLGKEAWAW